MPQQLPQSFKFDNRRKGFAYIVNQDNSNGSEKQPYFFIAANAFIQRPWKGFKKKKTPI